ncbi:CU044_5270 family protein [Amycolatopsis magusensis]|uniref:CU044_5270 family protein n=1 Tax=Amycolatopsis magusensis TaxID=882444 RepID=UPI003788807D
MADRNTDENVRQVWSEDDLDRALAALNAEVPAGEAALAKARAELMGEAGAVPAPEPRQHRRRRVSWAAAFGTVAAVVAGVLVLPALPFGDEPGVPGAAAEVLNRSADRIGAIDEPVPPGHYRYVETHAWHMVLRETGSYLGEGVTRVWVPAEWTQQWRQDGYSTGQRKWIEGSDADLPEEVRHRGPESVKTSLARCGDFMAEPDQQCHTPGGWGKPTPEFLGTLPSDPVQLYQRLRADTAGKGPDPDVEMVVYAADALRGGLLPATVRANLYRALAVMPSLEISDRHANLDGRIGVAFGVDRAGIKQEIIIDPGTGQFIGERMTSSSSGEVVSYTSVSTGVVGEIGALPVK